MSFLAPRRAAEVVIVYLSGLAQGLCLVTFPAASNIFKSAEFHQLTSSEYGSLFVPMVLCAILASLHAVLGTGTALAPVLLGFFVGMGWWWGLPVAIGVVFLTLIGASAGRGLEVVHADQGGQQSDLIFLLRRLPARFWIISGTVLLYGMCETVLGNWATIYLHEDKGLALQEAGLALAAFWAMVTVGRVAAAAASVWLPARSIYLALPVMILAAFSGIPAIGGTGANIVAFGFAGLACSAFLPLTISFAEQEFAEMAEIVSGGLMAAYMLGYGIGAFGVGPLRETGGLTLSTIYAASSGPAALLALLAYFLSRGRVTA